MLTEDQLSNRTVCQLHFETRMFDAHGVRLPKAYACLFSKDEISQGVPLVTGWNLKEEHNYSLEAEDDKHEDKQLMSPESYFILRPEDFPSTSGLLTSNTFTVKEAIRLILYKIETLLKLIRNIKDSHKMENIHRRAIQSNFVSLVEQTDLDLMVSVLYEKGVFSEQMIEKYKDTTIHLRTRKRQLYMDIMLRGPHAFGHLTDALQEAGYWNLARDLDPNSSLHTRNHHNPRPQPQPHPSGENSYISLSNKKKDRNRTDLETQKNAVLDEVKPQQLMKPAPYEGEPNDYIPHFDVKKSAKFYDEVDAKGIKPYRMRGKRGERGALVVFSYIEFQHGIEELRNGADVDAEKLKYLFAELGFKVCSYLNLTRDKTEEYLKLMNQVLSGVECAFIVVSSHGYQRGTAVDVDFRCSDGRLMSVLEFLEYFSNEQLPALVGVPKVFIFQLCRGPQQLPLPHALGGGEGPSLSDGTASAPPEGSADVGPLPPAPPPALAPPKNMRQYSDILIAHSTLPGYVSRRDPEHGSWYIQALCEVFAAHAHDCHVDKLLKLVDVRLEERFRVQTSTVEGWGFNRRLYLHPGLYES